jgi:hypothetical protein
MGRFSKEWSTHQRLYLATLQGDGDLDSVNSTWQANLIQLIWEQWYHLWKQRNGEVHGSDEKTRTDAAKREMRRQLEEIYSQRSMYETHVQELLHRELEDHDQCSLVVTKNWLLSINAPIFRESYRRVKRKVVTGMLSIREYFTVR